jgi:hypothetical protein
MTEYNRLEFINNELKAFSLTEAAIAELTEQFMPLVINGIDDKEGLKQVSAARKEIKARRIDVDKRRKELVADALEYQRCINGEAKRITELLEPIETHLINEEKKVNDEIERLRLEKETAETTKLQTRIKQLLALKFQFDGVQYITDYLDTFNNERIYIATLHLKQIDDVAFAEFYDNAKHYFEIHQSEAAERERLRQEQLIKEEAERKAEVEKLAVERARLDAIAKEQAERELALREEAARLEYEKSKEAVMQPCPPECEAPIHQKEAVPVVSPQLLEQGSICDVVYNPDKKQFDVVKSFVPDKETFGYVVELVIKTLDAESDSTDDELYKEHIIRIKQAIAGELENLV